MRKYIYYIFVLFVAGFTVSCEKHELSYDNTVVDPSTQAQFRLMYDISDLTDDNKAITTLKYNGEVVSVVNTKLGQGFPNSAGKYHVLPIGSLTVNMYRGTTEVYNQATTLSTGRQTGFVYDLTQPPLMTMDEPFPVSDPWLDTCCYIKFVNLLYATDGVTPYGKLTLQVYRDASTVKGTVTNEYFSIATIDFKEVSGWIKFDLRRSKDANRVPITNWGGTESNLVFRLIDQSNNIIYANFTSASASTQGLTKGLCYFLHANGRGNSSTANGSKRLGVWQVR